MKTRELSRAALLVCWALGCGSPDDPATANATTGSGGSGGNGGSSGNGSAATSPTAGNNTAFAGKTGMSGGAAGRCATPFTSDSGIAKTSP